MKAEVSPLLATGLAAWLLILSGLAWDARRAATRAEGRDQPVASGLGPTATAHEALQARVARQDVIIAELAQNSTEMGAALRDSRKSAKVMQSTIDRLGARLTATEGELEREARRRTQGEEPEPEPAQGEVVLQITREVSRVQCGGPGSTTADGHFDYSRCSERGFQQCHQAACMGANWDHSHPGDDSGGKHRRAQAERRCKPADLATRSAEVTAECCDEPTEDCTGGTPHVCNEGCAAIFLPFWGDCRTALGEDSGRFEDAVALCEATVASGATAGPSTALSLAEQLNVQCTDGTATEDCVPTCTARLHGVLLLLNIDGEDSKLSCELHHALYSWVGAATDGGYLGRDPTSFFSAVASGAAGFYILMLLQDAGIGTNLIVKPGQVLNLTGQPVGVSPPSWGSGGWTVQQGGSLAMTSITSTGTF
eukprot:COSAG04_NODE_1696_length_5900_cov_86.704706_8_plen_424_part_01